MDVNELTLNCWVRSEDPGRIFQVKISDAQTVFDLQEVIKNEKLATFQNVDADALDLYKPTAFRSRPYKDNLSKLTLSDHAEFLEGAYKLSEIFPGPPPVDDIHVIVDAPSAIVCWLRGTTPNSSFRFLIRPGEDVAQLISRIRDDPNLSDVAHQPIRLYRISGDKNELRECLNQTGGGELIQGGTLAFGFLGVPVLDPLRVVIEVGAIGGSSPTLVQEPIGHRDALREYEHILLKVKKWGGFEQSDIERNQIVEAQNLMIPELVTKFERKFVRKPHLSSNTLRLDDAVRTYFEDQIAEGESPEETRYAGLSEAYHTAYIAHFEWQESWQPRGPYKRPLKGHAADWIFFHALLHNAKNRRATALKDKSWPIDVVVKCDGDDELRKYCPRSDLLISVTTLPRLLVEVNSTSQISWPMDLIRMLTTGAFIVRFANNFVSKFSQEKNFVLCAFFIWDSGTATRYTLFQQQTRNDETVYYNMKEFSLNDPLGRVEFARHLYTLLDAKLDEDQNQVEKEAINKLHSKIQSCKLESMYTRTPTGQNNSRGGGDLAQLRAHGYEVEPEVIVDASGGEWEPLSKSPDHILTVYRPTDSTEEIIAKKVWKGSNELEIFRLFDTFALKSDHVISLIDSFDGWLILPKLVTIQDYIDFRDTKVFERKVSQVCLGVIKGVAYLHEHRIAHGDIKPDNLVVDKNFNSKIIDFDIAMRVKDDDEEVDDQCGTRGWMAHEVEKGLRHSPIKADRWACGRVILLLLDEFCKEDESLRAFAKDLVSHDPKQRPSLLEWGRYLASPLSNAENFDAEGLTASTRPRSQQRRHDDAPECEEAET